ncbi:hypothetical protein [Paracoccus sp. S3-43]|uniref:hypothetical protein n=1 Tax=Paracoccus sp. S3-43 TaxID=3030011 RepID=UPI0023B07235|nr:hypothetical protein [Paracoccus sp. S3-43]WEF23882.1 hypothetical protein PXD02_13995 [Paracoccus sp. S3-43]
MADLAGVMVDVEIVTGEEHDTGRFEERLNAIENVLGGFPGPDHGGQDPWRGPGLRRP